MFSDSQFTYRFYGMHDGVEWFLGKVLSEWHKLQKAIFFFASHQLSLSARPPAGWGRQIRGEYPPKLFRRGNRNWHSLLPHLLFPFRTWWVGYPRKKVLELFPSVFLPMTSIYLPKPTVFFIMFILQKKAKKENSWQTVWEARFEAFSACSFAIYAWHSFSRSAAFLKVGCILMTV